MSLPTIQQQISKLSLTELKELDIWLHNLIQQKQEIIPEIFVKQGREVVQQVRQGTITYQLEQVKCGKEKCKCSQGELHGPYWYAYWSDKGKTRSRYVGKELKTESQPVTSQESE